MSVFGGDSWGREAQYRKRRVDDLLLEAAGDHSSSSYRKLHTGKYVCLVCPHNPVIDTPLMLSMHLKARRHLAAELMLKQREEERQKEMNKRIALSPNSTSMTKTDNISSKHTARKPLIEKTRKATFEVLHLGHPGQTAINNSQSRYPISEPYDLTISTVSQVDGSGKKVMQLPLDYQERRERELKFTAAGWKRDCHGRWYRDEIVEFDSDEEDPNDSLANEK